MAKRNEMSLGKAGSRVVRYRAAKYAGDPQALDQLVDEASDKAKRNKGPLKRAFRDLKQLIRMLRAYASGRYRKLPVRTLVLVSAAVLYFVMPLDFIPDIIFGIGLLDDAAVIAWTLAAVRGDLTEFSNWESKQGEVVETV